MSAKSRKSIVEELADLIQESTDSERGWQQHGLCRSLEPRIADELFFPVDIKDPLRKERHKLCSQCPVNAECLKYGNEVSPQYGSWGGFSPAERRIARRYRGRLAPPKAYEIEQRASAR